MLTTSWMALSLTLAMATTPGADAMVVPNVGLDIEIALLALELDRTTGPSLDFEEADVVHVGQFAFITAWVNGESDGGGVDGFVLGAGLGIGAVSLFHVAESLSPLIQSGGAGEPTKPRHLRGTSISVDPLRDGAMFIVTGSLG